MNYSTHTHLTIIMYFLDILCTIYNNKFYVFVSGWLSSLSNVSSPASAIAFSSASFSCLSFIMCHKRLLNVLYRVTILFEKTFLPISGQLMSRSMPSSYKCTKKLLEKDLASLV